MTLFEFAVPLIALGVAVAAYALTPTRAQAKAERPAEPRNHLTRR